MEAGLREKRTMAQAFRYEHATTQPMGEQQERAIDLVHLARQTLGDHELEAEILSLFVRQSRNLSGRIGAAPDARTRGDLAHTLKGSARAVGAWRIARNAEAIEVIEDPAELPAAVAKLAGSVEEAISMIQAFADR